MKRLSAVEVELEPRELLARELFGEYLSSGLSIKNAAKLAMLRLRPTHGVFSPDFVAYLSEGTLIVSGNRYRPAPTT